MLVTYMGAKDLTTPGGVVEIDLDGKVVAEYDAAKPGGPERYTPSVNPNPRINGETDTGCWPTHTGSMPARTWICW